MGLLVGSAVDHIVALLQLGQKPGDLVWGGLEVVVDCDNDAVLRGPDAAEKRTMLPVVAHEVEAVNPGIVRSKTLNHIPASVPAAIVHKNQLTQPRPWPQHLTKTIGQQRQAPLSVVNR